MSTFSIIVPTFNSEKFLWECLASICQQSHTKEIIIVDGGSRDKTLWIADWYRIGNPRVSWTVISEKDKGEPDAINKGLKIASGDIVTFLDSDDMYCKHAFDYVDRLIGITKWCYGKCTIIDENNKKVRQIVTKAKELLQQKYDYKNLLKVDFLAQPAVFLTREGIEEVGKLDITDKLGFDYDWWLRFGARSKPVFINQYLAYWRAHGQNPSMRFYKEQAKNALRLQKKYSLNNKVGIESYAVYYSTITLYWLLEQLNGAKRQNRQSERILGQKV